MRQMAAICGLMAAVLAAIPARAQSAPPKELVRLQFLVGAARGTSRTVGKKGPVDDAPTSTTGKWVSDGWQLVLESELTVEGSRYVDLTVFSYDPDKKKYMAWQYEPGKAAPTEWTGQWEGRRLVFLSPTDRGGTGGLNYRNVEQGLQVIDVADEGPAAKVGVQHGDIITRINGKAAVTTEGEEARFGKPGDTQRWTVVRNGKPLNVTFRLGPPPTAKMILEPGADGRYTLTMGMTAYDDFAWSVKSSLAPVR